MASRIQGITVEIGGDTTKLSKALESVNKSIKGTQSGLKDVNKLLKLDPSNTELVVQKQKMLKDAIEATKEKLATLKTAAQQANPDKQQCCRYGDKHSQQNIQTGGKPKKQGCDKTDQDLCHCHGNQRKCISGYKIP